MKPTQRHKALHSELRWLNIRLDLLSNIELLIVMWLLVLYCFIRKIVLKASWIVALVISHVFYGQS